MNIDTSTYDTYSDCYEALEGTFMEGQPVSLYIPDKDIAIQYCPLVDFSESALTTRLGSAKEAKEYNYNMGIASSLNDIHLITIFEPEWIYKRPIVESRIQAIFGNSKRVYGRKCSVVELDNIDASDFMDRNHVLAYTNSSIRYGLMYDNELIAAMTFAKVKYRFTENSYELSRYASKMGYSVVGGASKLLKHFIRSNPNCRDLITYVDKRYSTRTTLYDTLGFRYSHDTKLSYQWFKEGSLILESKDTYDKPGPFEVYDTKLTRYETCLLNGVQRIWGCGNAVYLMDLEKSRSKDEKK